MAENAVKAMKTWSLKEHDKEEDRSLKTEA